QAIFVKNGYRPTAAGVPGAGTFPTPSGLFTIKDLGGWTEVAKTFFDPEGSIMADVERKIGVSVKRGHAGGQQRPAGRPGVPRPADRAPPPGHRAPRHPASGPPATAGPDHLRPGADRCAALATSPEPRGGARPGHGGHVSQPDRPDPAGGGRVAVGGERAGRVLDPGQEPGGVVGAPADDR